jgi:hypothetical protein
MESDDRLLGLGHQPANLASSADDFSRFFFHEVDAVRQSTEGLLDPVISNVHLGCLYDKFAGSGSDDVIASIRRLPDKQSSSDVFQFLC